MVSVCVVRIKKSEWQGSSAVMASDSSLRLSAGSQTNNQYRNIKVMKNLPSPEEWTLVKEKNMEKRAPCEVGNLASSLGFEGLCYTLHPFFRYGGRG